MSWRVDPRLDRQGNAVLGHAADGAGARWGGVTLVGGVEHERIARWWALLSDLERQRVREFRRAAQLPGDLVASYGRIVGGGVSSCWGATSGVYEMPAPLIRFLQG